VIWKDENQEEISNFFLIFARFHADRIAAKNQNKIMREVGVKK